MSRECGNCPFNQTDCENPLCVTAGGKQRLITTVNYQIPGPAVLVCLNDTVIVNVHNGFETDSTTIHFHGAHQNGSPWMDGVPFITQCPILPGTTYQHKFIAGQAGTHMYHGHSGTHEADGLFGQYIVRKPEDFNKHELYDLDLPEHTMIFWHWFDRPVGEIFALQNFASTGMPPYDILINGKSEKEVYTKDGKNYKTPRAVFEVEQGKRYRFRAIFNSIIYCPVQVSIDNHNLTMIGSDSGEFNPVEVETFIGNAGERYDFVLNANAPIGTYWIRVRGVGNECKSGKINQQAILKYKKSELEVPKQDVPTYDESGRSGKLLNPMDLALTSYPENDVIVFTELESPEPTRNINGTPDVTIYLEFKTYTHSSIRYPQMNNLTFSYPKSPLLTQWNRTDINCSPKLRKYNCVDNFCTCPYTEIMKKGDLVEIVLVALDPFPIGDHPMHLHGNHFQVVAMETVGKNISTQHIRDLNLAGKIPKKLEKVPYKDTISVPSEGYAILRFVADNPGYWFFHCHLSIHAAKGMAVVIKVGEDIVDIPTAPQDIPRCGDFPSLPPYY
ncbi:laccase-8-like [Chrysoperla carnea]|uniref:laccase-8-like n=1 Tax=Chrysoperla carnea TaxID=189513 RepID=UPI001D091446|nr:laccase-8-like [Chrysoperla carnea]